MVANNTQDHKTQLWGSHQACQPSFGCPKCLALRNAIILPERFEKINIFSIIDSFSIHRWEISQSLSALFVLRTKRILHLEIIGTHIWQWKCFILKGTLQKSNISLTQTLWNPGNGNTLFSYFIQICANMILYYNA